ncbi:hypothetical protein TNCV_2125331 [Trichonephila clavipes]|nr:hypothetical protein TNCV_2125331 [Trichonephila clavipes]
MKLKGQRFVDSDEVLKLLNFATNFEKNPESLELAKNDHHLDLQVAKLIAKHDNNLSLLPRLRQIPIESPL